MAEIKGNIEKWRTGERVGAAATAVCAATVIFFIVCFSIARALGLHALQLTALIVSPVVLAAAAAVAALCNIFYGGALDRAVKDYIVEVSVEQAALFRPEKNSLTFRISFEENSVVMRVNGYKDKIEFDFFLFWKIGAARKLSLISAAEERLCVTFCRLYERGAGYTRVSYSESGGSRKKDGKEFYIIKDGAPDRRAYKTYLKTTARK